MYNFVDCLLENEAKESPLAEDGVNLLMDSPESESKEKAESSLGDDFDKLDNENLGYEDEPQDTKEDEHLGEDYDIIGEIDEQHFEVLDSAGETENETLVTTKGNESTSINATSSADEGTVQVFFETNDSFIHVPTAHPLLGVGSCIEHSYIIIVDW